VSSILQYHWGQLSSQADPKIKQVLPNDRYNSTGTLKRIREYPDIGWKGGGNKENGVRIRGSENREEARTIQCLDS
jgi:hypothetical protein